MLSIYSLALVGFGTSNQKSYGNNNREVPHTPASTRIWILMSCQPHEVIPQMVDRHLPTDT